MEEREKKKIIDKRPSNGWRNEELLCDYGPPSVILGGVDKVDKEREREMNEKKEK